MSNVVYSDVVLKSEDFVFGQLNKIHGNSINTKVHKFDNGATLYTTRKVTCHKGGMIKTNYLHICLEYKNGVKKYWREQANGNFKRL